MVQRDALPIPKRPLPTERSLSNSERQVFTTCRKKWFWTYARRYTPMSTPTPFLVGSAIHDVLAQFYRGEAPDIDATINGLFDPVIKGTDGKFLDEKQLEDVEKQRTMTLGMAAAYLKVYADDLKKWKIIKIDGEPAVELEGKFRVNKRWDMYFTVDALVEWKGKPWVLEHKTTSAIDAGYISRLSLDDQCSTYMVGTKHAWGIEPAGVIYNVIMKPRIRQKQKETRDQYLERVLGLYQDSPHEYLYRTNVLRSEADLAEFERETNLFTGEMDRSEESGFYYKNTRACTNWGSTCPMMPLCIEGEDQAKERFKIKESRSQYREDED